MTVYNVLKITIPEDYAIIEMTYQQFRRFHKGYWHEGIYFKTPEGYLYSFHNTHRRVMVCKHES